MRRGPLRPRSPAPVHRGTKRVAPERAAAKDIRHRRRRRRGLCTCETQFNRIKRAKKSTDVRTPPRPPAQRYGESGSDGRQRSSAFGHGAACPRIDCVASCTRAFAAGSGWPVSVRERSVGSLLIHQNVNSRTPGCQPPRTNTYF